MRGLHHSPAKRPVPEAFLASASAEEGDLTQSRKAAKRPASILRPVVSRNASREEIPSLCAFAPLRDQSFLATEDLAQSHKATKLDRATPVGNGYAAALAALRAVAMLCDPVVLGNRR
ncbi:hypothetical protein [Sphingomonas sp. PAMC 26617]|uniref:hypothetical protein n=1 Tax=Sphingomonas sp. PAMC 26617 TaxID=1112216 RepID=UPI0012F4F567|nr:hypothetical protein [Sphingomonas sp. PAMC 26617]